MIAKEKVVEIDYTLKNDRGEVLDSSQGEAPLTYLHGHGQIIPGLERELEGKKIGDSFKVTVSAKDGYGEHNPSLTQTVPKSEFKGVKDLAIGMQFEVQSSHGPMIVTVAQIKEKEVVIDGNHPLAGQTLHFEVAVKTIRAATKEEISHGHAHGAGGHHH